MDGGNGLGSEKSLHDGYERVLRIRRGIAEIEALQRIRVINLCKCCYLEPKNCYLGSKNCYLGYRMQFFR